MFESWLEQEKRFMKSHYENVRILCIFIAVFIVFAALTLVLLLEGSLVIILFSIIFAVFLIGLALVMTSDKKQFMKPLMASVQQELPTEEKRQAFAQQMQEHTTCISYQPVPQTKTCDIIVAKDYCYVRQPRKCSIIRNSQIRQIILDLEDYYTGNRGHVRWCYAVALHTSDNENPVWKGFFMDKDSATQAFSQLQTVLPPEATAKDFIAHPEKRAKKSQWKFWLEWTLCMLFLAALCLLIRHFQGL